MDGSEIAAIKQRISANDIKQAINECRELGRAEFRKRYGLGRAKRYFLKIGNERFDAKAIVCVAARFVQGSLGPFTRKDIHGGSETVRVLEALGFKVEDIGVLAITDDDSDPEPFDATNIEDARKRTKRNIVQRRGQPEFRKALLNAYNERCAISGCASTEVLEAAHIYPYLGPQTNHVTNGLLLRADIHTLFDLGFVRIDPDTLRVVVDEIIKDPLYRKLDGKPLRKPNESASAPSNEALRHKFDDDVG